MPQTSTTTPLLALLVRKAMKAAFFVERKGSVHLQILLFSNKFSEKTSKNTLIITGFSNKLRAYIPEGHVTRTNTEKA